MTDVEIVQIIANGGPYVLASVLGYLYWLERTERREVQRERNELLEKAFAIFNEVKNTQTDLRNVLIDVKDALKEIKAIVTGRAP
jgi:hypothetical protein